MIWLALGLLVLGMLLGAGGMRRHLKTVGASWRPAAGILAIAALFGAGILALRESWAGALLLAAVGGWLALEARRRRGAKPSSSSPVSSRGRMSVTDAAALLGVPEDADEATVKAAYLRLVRRTHPDAGGTSGLTAQLNAARDVMLSRRK